MLPTVPKGLASERNSDHWNSTMGVSNWKVLSRSNTLLVYGGMIGVGPIVWLTIWLKMWLRQCSTYLLITLFFNFYQTANLPVMVGSTSPGVKFGHSHEECNYFESPPLWCSTHLTWNFSKSRRIPTHWEDENEFFEFGPGILFGSKFRSKSFIPIFYIWIWVYISPGMLIIFS